MGVWVQAYLLPQVKGAGRMGRARDFMLSFCQTSGFIFKDMASLPAVTQILVGLLPQQSFGQYKEIWVCGAWASHCLQG